MNGHVLPARQRKVIESLGPVLSALGFYLTGGTALALQLGHRQSADFDWFREAEIDDPQRLARDIQQRGIELVVRSTAPHTLHGSIDGVSVSFLEYRYPLLQPLVEWPEAHCRLASLQDLAATKLSAIAQRGAKRDFVDIIALENAGIDLTRMLACYQARFSIQDVGHVLTALTYFDDAERDEMPVCLQAQQWDDVKATIRQWVKSYVGH